MKLLVLAACLFPIAAFAQPAATPGQATAATAAPPAAVNCADWRKTPDGEWKSRADTVVSYQGQQLTMHKTTVEQGQYFIKDQDVYTLVDATCSG